MNMNKLNISIEESSPEMLTSSSESESESEDSSSNSNHSPIKFIKPLSKESRRKSYEIDESGTFRSQGLVISPLDADLETLIEEQKKRTKSRGYSASSNLSESSLSTNTQSSYIILGTLGSGASATVYSAMHIHSMHIVALKKISLFDTKTRHQMLSELQLLRRFNHISCDDMQRRRCFDCGAFAGCYNANSSKDFTSSSSIKKNKKRKSIINHLRHANLRSRMSFELRGSKHTRRHCSSCEAFFCGNCKKSRMRSAGFHVWICVDCEASAKLPYAIVSSKCINILKLHDVFVSLDEGRVSIVTELMDLGSLQSIIDSKQRFTASFLAIVVDAILKALTHLHSQRLIHRDIKPANILFNSTGQVKLSDFGLMVECKESFILSQSSDSPRQHAGTTSYMCPRRIRGKNATPAGDVWGLGATILACSLGRTPFDAQDYFAMMDKICDEAIPEINDDLLCEGHSGEHLSDFVKKCLIRKEKDRPSAEYLLKNHKFPLSLKVMQHADRENKNKKSWTLMTGHDANMYRHKALAEWLQIHNSTTVLKSKDVRKSVTCLLRSTDLLRKRAYLGIPSKQDSKRNAKVGTEAWFENGRIQIVQEAARAVLSYHSQRILFALSNSKNEEHEKVEVDIVCMGFLRVSYEVEPGKMSWVSRWVELSSSGVLCLYKVTVEKKKKSNEGSTTPRLGIRKTGVKKCMHLYKRNDSVIIVESVGNKPRKKSITSDIVNTIKSIRLKNEDVSDSSSRILDLYDSDEVHVGSILEDDESSSDEKQKKYSRYSFDSNSSTFHSFSCPDRNAHPTIVFVQIWSIPFLRGAPRPLWSSPRRTKYLETPVKHFEHLRCYPYRNLPRIFLYFEYVLK